jgi:hypothetical protein
MFRKALIALAIVTAATAFMPAEASARGGFGGGGFHGGFAGVSCCRFDGHLVKLIPPYVRTQPG